MNTLVIGDVHGHYDRLEALLKQEGILGECLACHGTGDINDDVGVSTSGDVVRETRMCTVCDGDGVARINHDIKVIQLGDLGHFGHGRDPITHKKIPGSPGADFLCWDAAVRKKWIDVILWGNHDAAVVDDTHEFTGFEKPPIETVHLMKLAASEGRLKLAYEVDGFLLTHAGLHKVFKTQRHVPSDPNVKLDSQAMAAWLNTKQDLEEVDGLPKTSENEDFVAIRDAIGKKRGGPSPYGGILWRDATESLYPEYRQIFGHSAGDKVRKYETPKGWSYCIDVGQQHNGHLAGIWLPNEKIVEVKL